MTASSRPRRARVVFGRPAPDPPAATAVAPPNGFRRTACRVATAPSSRPSSTCGISMEDGRLAGTTGAAGVPGRNDGPDNTHHQAPAIATSNPAATALRTLTGGIVA